MRRILCPIDFSSHSRRALRYAASLAGTRGASLTIQYVNDPLLVAAAAAAAIDPRTARVDVSDLEQFAARALAGATRRRRVRLKFVVSSGDPSAEITKAARRLRADVVVMGTHGRTGIDKVLLGSTTRRVLERSTVPVLALPPGGRRR
jgi:nucleotide-binding universal stress UspA family protein